MDLLKYKDFYDYGLPHAKAGNPQQIMENIEHLYQKMKQCTRNVTYFDLYKINTVITQDSEFEAQINALEPHSTAIINSNITTTSQVYSPGDMVVKNMDGTTTTIIAQRGGIFYPKKVKKVNEDGENFSYDFSFDFKSAAPAIGTTSDSKSDEDGMELTAEFAEMISFKGLSGGTPTSPYNLVKSKPEEGWISGDGITISDTGTMTINIDAGYIKKDSDDTDSTDTTPIDPIVHCYADVEEIYVDQEISYIPADEENDKGSFDITLQKTNLCTKVVIK